MRDFCGSRVGFFLGANYRNVGAGFVRTEYATDTQEAIVAWERGFCGSRIGFLGASYRNVEGEAQDLLAVDVDLLSPALRKCL